MWKPVVLLGLVACGPGDRDGGVTADAARGVDAVTGLDANPCPPPPNPAGADVELAPPFDTHYTVYDLGPVPGVPNNLGGTVIRSSNPNQLLIAGASETTSGAIYAIGVVRDACDHIVGWNGTATLIASTPYVDANLVYWNNDLLLYTEWPQHHLSQLAGASTAPDRRTDLRTVGLDGTFDSGPGGLGLVPPNLSVTDRLRLVTWPGGHWYQVTASPDGNLVTIDAVTQTTTLPNQPGGFAYVPAGSPGFPAQSLIVAEWRTDSTLDRVAVYEVDAQGDPVIATRKEFFARFPRPWGAYFEPVTGDYLFLSWGTGNDRVFIVQGFLPPVLL
jgi:hypothetical protein